MKTSKLSDLMSTAKEDFKAPDILETGNYDFEITDAKFSDQLYPQIGLYAKKLDDGTKRWFNLSFDPTREKSVKISALNLVRLGLDGAVSAAEEMYPDNLSSQLSAVAAAMIGIKFNGKIAKVETANGARNFLNYVNSVIEDDDQPTSASGFGAGSAL